MFGEYSDEGQDGDDDVTAAAAPLWGADFKRSGGVLLFLSIGYLKP